LDISKAISRKRCKIGGKLVLITNRKSYVSFRLVGLPKSVILNDLERHSGPYFRYFAEFGSFRGACVKVVADRPTPKIFRQKCSPKHLVFSDVYLR